MASKAADKSADRNPVDRYELLFRLEILSAIGCGLIALYGLCFWGSGQVLRIVGVGILVGGAALLSGFLLGFIFGVPRVDGGKPGGSESGTSTAAGVAADSQSSPVTPNSNLVEISDWLTKIIVGVGLVELKTIPDRLGKLSWYLGSGLRPAQCDPHLSCADSIGSGQAAGLAIIIFYFALGFLFGYVWTRLYFQRDLSATIEGLLRHVQAYDLIMLAEASINEQQLDKAMSTIDKALANNPKDGRAVLTKARIFKRQAMNAQQPERDRLLTHALTFADRAIALLPGQAEPIYNKACYEALLKADKTEILDSLKSAFELNPALRNTAQADADLDDLRQDVDFNNLVGENPIRPLDNGPRPS